MALVTTMTGSCSGTPSCSAIGTGDITYWAPKFYSVTTKTGTVVVVHIINTVSNTTRISTIAKDVPPGFMPPPTNFGGTRTSKATYERGGTLLTTAVTHPTPFLNMPTAYTIEGDYQLGSKCVQDANQAYAIPKNLQPNWRFGDATWNLSKEYDPTDDLGWSWTYKGTTNHTRTFNMKELINVLPDDNPDMPHSVVLGCQPEIPPQPYVLTANPYWKVVGRKSVAYESQTPATAAAGAAKKNTEEPSADLGPGQQTWEAGETGAAGAAGAIGGGDTKDGATASVGGAMATGTLNSPASGQKPGQKLGSKSLGSATVPWSLWTAAVGYALLLLCAQ